MSVIGHSSFLQDFLHDIQMHSDDATHHSIPLTFALLRGHKTRLLHALVLRVNNGHHHKV